MKDSKKTLKRKSSDPLFGDLSELLEHGTWQGVRFELKPKNKTVSIRMNEELLVELKKRAKHVGVDYQKFIRITLEHSLRKAS